MLIFVLVLERLIGVTHPAKIKSLCRLYHVLNGLITVFKQIRYNHFYNCVTQKVYDS